MKLTCKPYNKVNNATGFYATFKVPNKVFISSCKLLFANINYDWLVQLEGSNDETNWFNINENQRIINLDNETIEFDHSILEFEPTNYSYYRIWVKNPTEKVTLEAVTITTSTSTPITKPTYKISPKFKVENKNKTTYIDIKLAAPVPIYSLSVKFSENIDLPNTLKMKPPLSLPPWIKIRLFLVLPLQTTYSSLFKTGIICLSRLVQLNLMPSTTN